MNAAQKSALEGVVDRELTVLEVEQIDPLLPDRMDTQIADILSVGRVRTKETLIGERTLFRAMGMAQAATFLGTIRNIAAGESELAVPLSYAVKWLDADKLDVGDAQVIAQIGILTAIGVLSPAQASVIKALAETPDPVSVSAVSDALNVAEGRMSL